MFPYDGQLLTLVESTPQSITDVIATLQGIDALCIEQDGLKWFNWLYLRITEAVAARIAEPSGGGLTNPAWLAELDVQFAAFYFEALRNWLSGTQPSSCWQVLFDSRQAGRVARVQFALAGVNAHINHDLCAAIVATCKVTDTAPIHGGAHYNDYTALNATLDTQIDAAKQILMIRLFGDALPPVSHLEDTIAAWNVTAAREKAWLNAQHLWHLQALPAIGATFLDTIDGFTTVIGKALLVPIP